MQLTNEYKFPESTKRIPEIKFEFLRAESVNVTPLPKAKRFTKEDEFGKPYCLRLVRVDLLTIAIHLKVIGDFQLGFTVIDDNNIWYRVEGQKNDVFDLIAHYEDKKFEFKIPQKFMLFASQYVEKCN